MRNCTRGKVNRLCYKESHRDQRRACVISPAHYWAAGIKKISVDLGVTPIEIMILPKELRESLRSSLHDIYAGGDEGVGIIPQWLNNAMRDNPGGWMSCLITRGMTDAGEPFPYVSCEEDRFGLKGSSNETFRFMSESFGEWLHDNMPEVWNEIRANNASEGWKAPGFFNSPHMISPRFFISDRLANEPHMDDNDRGICVVYWIKDSETDDDADWQFIFESVTTGSGDSQRDTLTIQLHDGVVIVFDGTKVRHCSSVPSCDSKRKFGVFHGASKFQKRNCK